MWDTRRVVPFVPPNEEERKAALGSLAGQKWRLKKSLLAIADLFTPIGPQKAGDWLFEYEEDGQPFGLYKSLEKNQFDPEVHKLYIGLFESGLDKEETLSLKRKAKAFFHGAKVKTKLMHAIDLASMQPITRADGKVFYNGQLLNRFFINQLPKDAYSMTVITSLFIYNPKNLQLQKFASKEEEDAWNTGENWVYGLASIKDRTGVVSRAKMQEDNEGGKVDEQEMLSKVLNHELAHTFRIKHCIYYHCLMNGSNGFHEASVKFVDLCPVCLRKLQDMLGFDLLQRYQALQQFDQWFKEPTQAIREAFA